MSTTSVPANQSMRQQLDELDALLQRMLNLPVNQVDEPANNPAVERARFAPPADLSPTPPPGRRPAMRLLDGSAPVAAPSGPPPSWDQHWNINLNPQQGSSVFGRSAVPPRPTPADQGDPQAGDPPVWRAETVAFPQAAAAARSQPVAAAAPAMAPTSVSQRFAEPPPLTLVPFIAVNRAFDAAVVWLGPVGEWLCTRTGRAVIGYAGLGLILGSVACGAAGWFGWPR